MSYYIPMYDSVGHGVKQEEFKSDPSATTTSETDVKYYAKLSPDTLLRQRTESEEYQVPSTGPNNNKKTASCQTKSTLLIALSVLLLVLLLVATVTAITLTFIERRNNAKLSAQLLEMHNEVTIMKRGFMRLCESLMQVSFERCHKDVVNCSVDPPPNTQVLSSCETAALVINKTGYYTLDTTCDHLSTFSYYSSYLPTAILKKTTNGQAISCLCKIVKPTTMGYNYLANGSFTCSMTITRCPLAMISSTEQPVA